ncbi:MAG TPA: hypothetical protein VIN04_01825 [Myxococcota bacterium]
MRPMLAAVLLAALAAAGPARAAFHLWKVEEVFSSADGTVQFVELSNAFDDEHFIEGHEVRVRAGGTTIASFAFPGHLEEDETAGRTLLLAPPGFATRAGVAPDYEIPAGFVDLAQATAVAFDALDELPLAGLPLAGRRSLNRGGVVADATPRNFAGVEGSLDLPEPASTGGGLAAGLALIGLARARARGARGRAPGRRAAARGGSAVPAAARAAAAC